MKVDREGEKKSKNKKKKKQTKGEEKEETVKWKLCIKLEVGA